MIDSATLAKRGLHEIQTPRRGGAMTPEELNEFAANFSGLADVGRVVAALKDAWAERDALRAQVAKAQEELVKQDAELVLRPKLRDE